MADVMVVTGGGRGLGQAVAELAGRRGYAVAIFYRSDAGSAKAVVDTIVAGGARAIAIQADVGREEDVTRAFATVDRELGPVRCLVNNAGHSGRKGRVDALDSREIMEILATNVCGTLLCCREAIRRMSTQSGGRGGSIVNLSSVAARLGAPGRNVHYAASKGAINSMTIGLSREVAGEGIRVNAVIPGLIDTESADRARVAELGPAVPIGRAGQPDEVAHAVLWLASDEASYVTGALVDVTGGR